VWQGTAMFVTGVGADRRILPGLAIRRIRSVPSKVLIADSAASFRRGLGSAFRAAGFVVEESPGLPATAGSADVVVATVADPDALVTLTNVLAGDAPPAVIVLADGQDPALVAEALRMGVAGFVDRDADPGLVVAAVEAALQGHALVPRWAAAAFAARIPVRPSGKEWVSEEEVDWLRLFAAGVTVAALATRVGYSEREMFRNLHDLYARIGVRNRTGALIWAQRHGLLEPPR